MAERLEGTVAIVVGAGQTPGDTIGNGRAAAILFARKGAQVMLVDRNLDFARETGEMIGAEGGEGFALQEANVTRAGRIDVLHNNVCIVGGDSGSSRVVRRAARARR